jgi:hypothetical protein
MEFAQAVEPRCCAWVFGAGIVQGVEGSAGGPSHLEVEEGSRDSQVRRRDTAEQASGSGVPSCRAGQQKTRCLHCQNGERAALRGGEAGTANMT